MKLVLRVAIVCVLLAHTVPSAAQVAPAGFSVTGSVIDSTTQAPLENVGVVLRSRSDSTQVQGTITGTNGRYAFEHVLPGAYVVECGLMGYRSFRSPEFVLSAANPRVELPPVRLRTAVLVLPELVVSTEKSLFNEAIDRRVYNVDHDLMARSSSASDVLQNIPSVQVDIDGNVSLRGSSDVMILINGRKSPLMGKHRADVLQQLPAAGIEKVELITNPSARYTPEGTSGIINIVTKRGAGSGVNGDLTGHLGTSERHNENLGLGYRPGKLELFGNYSHRDDLRQRFGTDDRILSGEATTQRLREANHVGTRSQVQLGTLGLNLHLDPKNRLELSGEHLERRPTRAGVSTIVSNDGEGAVLSDHDRLQTGGTIEHESAATAAFEHDFAKQEHSLRIEANTSDNPGTERAHFVEHWRTPLRPDPASDVSLVEAERMGHMTLDYANPVNTKTRLEAGLALDVEQQDIRSDADSLDVTQGEFLVDPARTYRFKLDQEVQAAYATYERDLGRFRVLAGLRGEYATVRSDLVTGGAPFTDRYTGLYPTLHTAWQASARGLLQLNYSRRIRRPERDDLNPFPQFTDPFNIEVGNPRLHPEAIHSYELSYRLRGDHFSFEPTLYVRDRSDAFTRITRALSDSTFLRTEVNLANDRSAGLEPVLTLSVGSLMQVNLNGNVFRDEIDASNLGYAGRRSVVSWSGSGNVTLTPRTATMLELNARYRSARLTPQGEFRPSFVLNVGARENLLRDRISLTLAVTDLLRTQRQDTELDVAGISQRVTNRRDGQVVYAGLTYHYGRGEKDDKKDKPMTYEDGP